MLTDFLARLLPRPVRRALRAPADAVSRRRFRAQLAASDFTLAQGAPALHYGGALPRGSGALVSGGRVKLTHLDRAFPEQHTSYNVLYLVSSAIPAQALELVRWAKSRGVRFVWNQNGVAYPAWAGKFTRDVNDPMRALLQAADFVVYQSEFCRESADRHLCRASCESAVLFNPVDHAVFAPAPTPLPPSPLRLLTMGTHTYADRVLVTLRCLADLRRGDRDATLTIAGRLQWENAESDVRDEISKLGLREHVTLRPAFSQAEAAELCRSHHLLLHAKYMDPCPTVVIEALACGLPVVGLESGGLPELVDARSGRLIPVPRDWDTMHTPSPTQFARAVKEIADRRPEFSAHARRGAEERFAAERWVDRHREIFTQVLKSAKVSA